MKKRFMYLAGLSLVVGILAGTAACGNAGESENTEYSVTDSATLDLDTYSLDDENAFYDGPGAYMAVTEDGIYYWSINNYLQFYDFASGSTVAVCSRTECLHEDASCNAYFASGDGYNTFQICYEDGYLYVECYNSESGEMSLYRVVPDGSTREKIMTLYEVATGGTSGDAYTYPALCIHDGYVYYVNYDEDVEKLRRAKLGSSDSEVLYAMGSETSFSNMISNGDFLFFGCYRFADDSYDSYEGSLYCYNYVSGEVTNLQAPYGAFAVTDDTLYYDSDLQLVARSLKDGSEEVILDRIEGSTFFVANETVYVLDNVNGILTAFDLNGKELSSFDGGTMFCSLSYEDYIYTDLVSGEMEIRQFISVEDFLNQEDAWIILDKENNSDD